MNSQIKHIKIMNLNQLVPVHTFWDRMKFHCASQAETESISEWLQRLNTLAMPCHYGGDTNIFLVERFILGLRKNTFNQLLSVNKDGLKFNEIIELVKGFQDKEPLCEIKNEWEDTSWIKEERHHGEYGNNEEMSEIVYCEAIDVNLGNCDTSKHGSTKTEPREADSKTLKKVEREVEDEEQKPGLAIASVSNIENSASMLFRWACDTTPKNSTKGRPKKATKKSPKAVLEPTKTKQEDNGVLVPKIENNPKKRRVRKQQIIKKLECDYCHTKWRYKASLTSHMRCHISEKLYMCDQCGKNFKYQSTLNNHLKTHTNVRPFKCETCQRAFARKDKLKSHQLTHTGIKNHHCTICGKAFAQNYNLKAHYLIHTDEKSFKCHICGKGYNQIRSLKTHISNHSKLDL